MAAGYTCVFSLSVEFQKYAGIGLMNKWNKVYCFMCFVYF